MTRKQWCALAVVLLIAWTAGGSPCTVPAPPPRECRITLDGRRVASLEDLPEGADLRVITDAWGRVVLIDAVSPKE